MKSYPKTPYWPGHAPMHWSEPAIVHPEGRLMHQNPQMFIGRPIVITEKLDGQCIGLRDGEVLDRSGNRSKSHPWLRRLRKHHAWKTIDDRYDGLTFWGENIEALHTIEYAPRPENEMFRVFAGQLRSGLTWPGGFMSWDDTERHAEALGIETVPVLFRGQVDWRSDLDELLVERLGVGRTKSAIGGKDQEGVVIRVAAAFSYVHFHVSVAKVVRPGHVKPTAKHWRRNWLPAAVQEVKA